VEPAEQVTWLPAWVERIALPVWVCDARQRIVHVNERAERVLGRSATDLLGVCCHEVVRGTNASGGRHCREDCLVQRLAQRGSEMEPFTIKLGEGGRRGGWTLTFVVPLEAPDGGDPWLVHCGYDLDRPRRIEEYVRRVASRTAPTPNLFHVPERGQLTRREREVLDLLADDADSHQVAARLHISHTTIRNHIQHILAKLQVHSVEEAIARHLLGDAERK